MPDASSLLEYGIAGLAVSALVLVVKLFLSALDKRDKQLDRIVDKHDDQHRYTTEQTKVSQDRLSDAINDLAVEIARNKS